MDKAWTRPPTAVPRADVGCDAKSSQGRNAPTRVRKHRPIQRASLPGRLQAEHRPFHAPRAGCPAQVLGGWIRSAESACPPWLKWAMFCSLETQGRGRRFAEILLTYTVVPSSLFPECRTTKVTPRARETSSPNQEEAADSAGPTTPPGAANEPRVQADRPWRRTAGSGTAPSPPLAGRAPHSRPGPGALPGSHHAARPRRRAAAAPGVLRARLPGDAAQVRDASRVPGDPLLDPGRPCALHRGGGGRQAPGERHEEPGGAFRALRERRRLAAGWCSPAVARCWPTASTTC